MQQSFVDHSYTNVWEGGLNCEAKAQDLVVTLFPESRGVTVGSVVHVHAYVACCVHGHC